MKLTTTDAIFEDLKKTFLLKGIDLSKIYIAGGSLLKDVPNDIDIYCSNEDVILKVEEALSIISYKNMKSEMSSTFFLDSYCCPVQVIKILVGEPDDVITQFDFEQNASYRKFSSNFPTYTNTSSDLILCKNIKTPNTMLTRLVKMLGKGYTIKKSELLKLTKLIETHYKDLPDHWNLSKKDLGSFYKKE